MGGFNPSGDSAAPPVFRLSVGLPLILMSLFGLGFSSGVVGLGFVIFFWGGGGVRVGFLGVIFGVWFENAEPVVLSASVGLGQRCVVCLCRVVGS